MRQNVNARVINVRKAELIEKIKTNKEAHIKDYNEAVEAYKVEAQKQIDKQQQDLKDGKLTIGIHLVPPVDKSEEYDKLVTMFEWEIKNEVELSQGEFNEYVLDENLFAVAARLSNATYKGSNIR